MIILDYPRRLKKIPDEPDARPSDAESPKSPFADWALDVRLAHRGHLGIMPEFRNLNVQVLTPYANGEGDAELLLTSHEVRPTGDLVRLQCHLREAVGVVSRVIEAIARLNINIVTTVSTVIDHARTHVVEFILDLTTCPIPRTPRRPGEVRARYRRFSHVFPIDDERRACLLESILSRCGSELTWHPRDGVDVPDIDITPLTHDPNAFLSSSASVRPVGPRVEGRPQSVYIVLPQWVAEVLDSKLRSGEGEEEGSGLERAW